MQAANEKLMMNKLGLRKLHVTDCSSNSKVHVLAFALQTTFKKLHIMQCMDSNDFTEHCIIRLLSACELVIKIFGW